MNDFTAELAKLHQLTGAEFSRQVERIALRKEFHPLDTDENIFSVGGEKSDDYQNLLVAARKAVEIGYKVYLLPNPKETRTADFILYKKGVYRVYDLKTIFGKSSVANSLEDSIGQCNRILLNLTIEYNTRSLAFAIKRYFEINQEAIEVLIFKGGMSTGLSSPICCFNDATLCNDIAVLFMIVEKFCINSLRLVNMERIEYLHILFLQGSDANT